MPFAKLLIANRGDAACRVARTAKRLGIPTVAVYSDADRAAPHVRACDEAVRIGPAPAIESYLSSDRLTDAIKQTGATAVHPGWGFLSEDSAFADAVGAAGAKFVGPSAESMTLVGSKASARKLMAAAGVPTIPGYDDEAQDDEALAAAAHAIGFPVLIKAAMGGGGKGLRPCLVEGDFQTQLEACRREAAAAFGDDRMVIEKLLLAPRHVEVQVVGDDHGNVVNLGTRDCSAQRRSQKLLEEAPAPGLRGDSERTIRQAAVDAARAAGYVNAGTVEFLVSAETGEWHFLEVNTRLQVEHGVTEMITGVDLVEWQLRVAAGEKLPIPDQAEIDARLAVGGHAIEARLYAESWSESAGALIPSIGQVTGFVPPAHIDADWLPGTGGSLRLDRSIESGDEISPYYDHTVAKILAHEPTPGPGARDSAVAALSKALGDTAVTGLHTNARFLQTLLAEDAVAAGGDALTIDYVDAEVGAIGLKAAPEPPTTADLALAAVSLALAREGREGLPADGSAALAEHARFSGPWDAATGGSWRSFGESTVRLDLVDRDDAAGKDSAARAVLVTAHRDGSHSVVVAPADFEAADVGGHPRTDDAAFASAGAVTHVVAAAALSDDGRLTATVDGLPAPRAYAAANGGAHAGERKVELWLSGGALFRFEERVYAPPDASGAAGIVVATAPMPGKLVSVLVAEGDTVAGGATVAVVEAMKMEHAVKAPAGSGTWVVGPIGGVVGDQVGEDTPLVQLMPPDEQ